ncbi:hypothetical protein RvY_13322-2 [Ramazzottius varieornatus]|uniref:TEP1-F n=1 Tax=Ramazzottius varieornatus TaxID=947166 RepID=A0A1D1VMG1_RAMVA|nr:hypothetical protein RvY_13322-2 [Ramazzottius varieornatus]
MGTTGWLSLLALLVGAAVAENDATMQLVDLVQDVDFTPPPIVYYVTSPRVVRNARPYPVSVTIQNASSPVAISIQLMEKFTPFYRYGDALETDYSEKETVLAVINGTVNPRTTQKFTLPVPAVGKDFGNRWGRGSSNRGLRIQGRDSNGNSFTDESYQINIEKKNNLIFIQTDKPLYKLGDSVKFRVIVVDLSLKPARVPVDIKIYDPQRNLIQQFLQVNQANAPADQQAGFFASDVQLASEAPLGSWSIEVSASEDETQTKSFPVEEYVLPRFDVKLSAPAYIIPIQDSFEVTLTANYTFGEPVKGKAEIRVSGPGKWVYELRRELKNTRNFTIDDFNGTAKVRVYVRDLVNDTNEFSDWNAISIVANVTEGTTQLERQANTQAVTLKRQAYKLDIVKSTNTFKPGFPYTIYVTATQHDGRPIPPTTKKMVVKISSSGSAFSSGYFDDEIKTFAVPANGSAMITITPAKEARNIFFTARLGKVSATTSIGGFDSPSNSFMQIYPITKNISVGQTAVFDVRLTNPFTLLNYTMVAKGQVLMESSVPVKDTSATITIPVTVQMAPRARLLTFYMRPDSEVVANVIDFEVSGLLQNNVTVSVRAQNRTEYAEPGESVSVRVETAPHSFVGMLAMDQSLLLLKSGNDITESDITGAVSGFDTDSWSFDDAFGSSKFKFPDGRSVFRFLEQAGLVVMSNAAIPGNPKNPDVDSNFGGRPPGVMYSMGGSHKRSRYRANGAAEAMPQVAFAAAPVMMDVATSNRAVAKGSAGGATEEPRLRKDFRETFLYETFPSGSSGVVEFSRPVPDTITSWVCSAFSLNDDKGLGITKDASLLKVFRPFFAVLNLPFAIVRGETVLLEVLVFNYLDEDQTVQVTLDITGQDSSGNQLATVPRNKTITVKSKDSTSVSFPVKPEVVGQLLIKATAISSMAGDSLQKTLRVKPEGIRQQFNAPLFVDLRKQNTFSADVLIPLPRADIVPGSEKIVFTAIGDLLGPTIYGIDSLINMPYGCGEQNMALFAPNVFVMKYLASAGRLDDDTKRRLLRNLRAGYQRQLVFKHADNSYSAFGDSDSSGSTFLTAFVARTFNQAKDFITIDQALIDNALTWLVNQQAPNGSFPEVGKVFDRELQGGAGKGTALTAYVLITLMESAQAANFSEHIRNATQFLDRQVADVLNDPYALSIVNYALQLAGYSSNTVLASKLNSLAIIANGTKHWAKEREVETQTYGKYVWEYKLPAKDIEMTAYGLLAAVRNKDVEGGFPILAWLLTKRNQQGGFQSSQDTVVGLQAISEFARLTTTKDRNIQVKIQTDGYKKDLTIKEENALVLQTEEPDKFYETVHVAASGTGTGLVQISWIYYVRNSTDYQGFAVSTNVRNGNTDLTLQVCSNYQKKTPSNMAVMEIYMPSGYQVDEEQAKKLIGPTPYLSRVDVEDEQTKVNLYFDKISEDRICVSLIAYRMFTVNDLQDANVVVYDYYNPMDRNTVTFNANKKSSNPPETDFLIGDTDSVAISQSTE